MGRRAEIEVMIIQIAAAQQSAKRLDMKLLKLILDMAMLEVVENHDLIYRRPKGSA